MRGRVDVDDRGALLARDLVSIGIPATQARFLAKKFVRLAPRPGNVYKKAAKAAHRRRHATEQMPGSRILRIEGKASDRIAISRTEGEFVIEPLRVHRNAKSATRNKQGKSSHK